MNRRTKYLDLTVKWVGVRITFSLKSLISWFQSKKLRLKTSVTDTERGVVAVSAQSRISI